MNATKLQSKEGKLLNKVAVVLGSYNCKPSLLHADLWMGNTGLTSTGEVAMFDPAAFIGDAEFDLAFQGWLPVPGFPGFCKYFVDAALAHYRAHIHDAPLTHFPGRRICSVNKKKRRVFVNFASTIITLGGCKSLAIGSNKQYLNGETISKEV